MPDHCKGLIGWESKDSFSEEEERAPHPEKGKKVKKKKELRYGT